MNMGFFPLFNHIKRNDIAMTSPVEMDYRGLFDPATGVQAKQDSMSWTMSFTAPVRLPRLVRTAAWW